MSEWAPMDKNIIVQVKTKNFTLFSANCISPPVSIEWY